MLPRLLTKHPIAALLKFYISQSLRYQSLEHHICVCLFYESELFQLLTIVKNLLNDGKCGLNEFAVI